MVADVSGKDPRDKMGELVGEDMGDQSGESGKSFQRFALGQRGRVGHGREAVAYRRLRAAQHPEDRGLRPEVEQVAVVVT